MVSCVAMEIYELTLGQALRIARTGALIVTAMVIMAFAFVPRANATCQLLIRSTANNGVWTMRGNPSVSNDGAVGGGGPSIMDLSRVRDGGVDLIQMPTSPRAMSCSVNSSGVVDKVVVTSPQGFLRFRLTGGTNRRAATYRGNLMFVIRPTMGGAATVVVSFTQPRLLEVNTVPDDFSGIRFETRFESGFEVVLKP
jgi:hypothetical protein